MKIFVTGGAGFIGSHLCEKLLKDGHQVTAIDNFDTFYDRKIKEKNISSLEVFPKFNLIEEDLLNKNFLQTHFASHGYDVVVHLAAKAGVRPSLKSPLDYVRANVEATVSLLESMKECGIKKFVFASSSSLYGKNKEAPFKEDDTLDQAISVYAATKQSGEKFTRMYHNLYDIDVINLRFFTVYGPRQRPDLAIHKFLKANLLDEEITLFGDGSMARDYTYVDDTVSGVIGAIKRISNNSNLYETYNLGNSTPVTLNELIAGIEKVTEKKCQINYKDVPPGDVPITYADISKSEKNLEYTPHTGLEEGLSKFYEWIKEIYS
jgi:UDP-glucuronate 4-epimerase